MTLDTSLAFLVARLEEWAGYPKYSLERRVDIFLTPFLQAAVGRMFGGVAELVLPEFPLLASLAPERAAKARSAGTPAGPAKRTAHTVNADYLLRLTEPGGKSSWVLLELKTDAGSFDEDQAALYLAARREGMVQLRKDIAWVASRPTAAKKKYGRLLDRLGPVPESSQQLRVVYLGPRSLRETVLGWKDELGRSIDGYISLRELAETPEPLLPSEHLDLWPHVRKLLGAIDP